MEWIPVKNKLPEKNCIVYVMNMNIKGWLQGKIARYDRKFQSFIYTPSGFYEALPLEVTHWIKLPDPIFLESE